MAIVVPGSLEAAMVVVQRWLPRRAVASEAAA